MKANNTKQTIHELSLQDSTSTSSHSQNPHKSLIRETGRKAFTLVELIIVITILAILATIAFMSFQGYMGQSRDANRASTLKNIETGIELFLAKSGTIPEPDNATTFTGGLKQGTIGANMVRSINMNEIPLDPLSKSPFKYSTFANGIYYQLATEKESSETSFVPQTYAEDNQLMISGNYSFDPSFPSLFVVKDSVGTTGIFSPNVCFIMEGGKNTFESASGSCIPKSNMVIANYESNLVAYWDMETRSGTLLKDLSGNGNNGTFTGGMIYENALTGGIIGQGLYFSGTWIEVPSSPSLNLGTSDFTVSATVKIGNTILPYAGILEKMSSVIQSGTYIYSGFLLDITNANNPRFDMGVGENIWTTNLRYSATISSAVLSTGGKYQLLVSKNNNSVNYYVNGVLIKSVLSYACNGVCSSSTNPYFIADSDAILSIGRDGRTGYNYGITRSFNGIIDDVKIYNRALSDQEILQQAKIAGF